jgi:hypothetical protein
LRAQARAAEGHAVPIFEFLNSLQHFPLSPQKKGQSSQFTRFSTNSLLSMFAPLFWAYSEFPITGRSATQVFHAPEGYGRKTNEKADSVQANSMKNYTGK